MATNPLIQQLIGTEGLIAPQKPKDLFASLLIKNGLDSSPVQHWTQGAARVAQALLGGLELRGQDADEAARKAAPDEIAGVVAPGTMSSGAPARQPPAGQPVQRPLPPPSVAPPAMASQPQMDNMEIPNSQVQRVNQQPPSFNDRFSAAMPPPNTGPVAQAAPSPAPPAPAGPMPSQPQASPPNILAQAEQMRKSKNPYVKAYGNQLLLQHGAKPPDFGVIGKDEYGNERRGWINPATGTTTPASQSSPTFVDTKKLRDEVRDLPSYKNLAQAAPVYKSMFEAAGRDNRAADVNLIYGMAKIMDPGSVVRESEMSVAQAVATLPQQLQSQIMSQLNSTGRLSPEVRAAIMQEAQSRIQSYQGMFDTDMGMYRGIAQEGRFNPAHVIPQFGPFDSFKPPPAPAPTGGPATNAPTSTPISQDALRQAIEELRRRTGR